jgi:hypothetical protein
MLVDIGIFHGIRAARALVLRIRVTRLRILAFVCRSDAFTPLRARMRRTVIAIAG